MKRSEKMLVKRAAVFLGGAAFTLVLAGCNSTRTEPQPSAYSATMARPIAADVYPVIEGKKLAATTQMSNEEAAAQSSRLTALGSARSSGKISEAEYQRRLRELQALAADHGADTLKQIQN